jgi:glucokinase
MNADNGPDYTLGIDLGGTKILAAVVDPQGKIAERVKRKTRVELGVEAVLDRVVRTAREAIEESGIDPRRIQSIGIGVPGPIDSESGVVNEAPNLGFVNLNIKHHLEERLHFPVVASNDVNAGTWGEYSMGAGRGCASCLGVFVGTGIGGGLVINHELYEGAAGLAGEIGHMCIDTDGPLCGCGRKGCLEALASRTAITRDIWNAIEKGNKSVLTSLVEKKGGQIRSGQLRRAYDEKDKVVTKTINRAAEYLGIGLASVANLLNPECIVLGGGVVTALGEPYLKRIQAAMAEHTFASIMKSTRLVMATLGDDAGILGAALLARRRTAARLAGVQ